MHGQARGGLRRAVAQGLNDHLRAQVRTADADIHHIGHDLAGSAPPLPRVHLVHDALHAAQLLVHLGGDVLAVHHAGRSLGQPQGPMHRRPALGGIHRLTAKESVDPLRQLLLASQIEQPLEGFHGQTLFGVVEQQRPAISVQALEALRIIGEELRQMGVLDVIGMLSQDPPHITYSPDMDRHTAKPKPPANRRSTRPGCKWGPARDANLCPLRARFAPGRCSYNKTKPCQRTCRSTRPGCEWGLPKTQICARFVRGSHRGGAPTTKTKSFRRTCRSTRPGCEWGLPKTLICARRVRGSHRGGPAIRRCSYSKNQNRLRTRRSTRPVCEWGPARAQIRARFVRGSHRGRCSYNKTTTCPEPVGAPAPGANGACPGRKSVPASFAVRTEAVLLQQNQTCPRTRRSTRPGCEWGPAGTLICARFVRGSHRGGAPTAKTKPCQRTRRSTRPGCEWGPTC